MTGCFYGRRRGCVKEALYEKTNILKQLIGMLHLTTEDSTYMALSNLKLVGDRELTQAKATTRIFST